VSKGFNYSGKDFIYSGFYFLLVIILGCGDFVKFFEIEKFMLLLGIVCNIWPNVWLGPSRYILYKKLNVQ